MKIGNMLIQSDWSYKLTAGSAVAIVNMVSLTGLIIWVHHNVSFWPLVIMLSLALESISVFLQHLAYYAEIRLMTGFRLKTASKLYALLVGYLNAEGFRQNGHWTKISLAIAVISASGPWLWGAFARQISYSRLHNAGAIEGRALKLGATRWCFHPMRSLKVMWISTWIWETSPVQAVANYELRQQAHKETARPKLNGQNNGRASTSARRPASKVNKKA